MQRAILSFPGNTGLTRLPPLLDHLWDLFPGASREAFIKEVGKTLLKLRHLGDLYLEQQYGTDRRPMTVDVWNNFSLLNFVEWDSDGQRWRVVLRQPGVEDIFVQLSQGGLDDLEFYESQRRASPAESE